MTYHDLFDMVDVIFMGPIACSAVHADIKVKPGHVIEVTEILHKHVDDRESTKVTTFELCDGGVMVTVYDEDGNTVHKKIMKERKFRNFFETITMLRDGE